MLISSSSKDDIKFLDGAAGGGTIDSKPLLSKRRDDEDGDEEAEEGVSREQARERERDDKIHILRVVGWVNILKSPGCLLAGPRSV